MSTVHTNKVYDLVAALYTIDPDTQHNITSIEAKMLGPQGGIRKLILHGADLMTEWEVLDKLNTECDTIDKVRQLLEKQEEEILELHGRLDDNRTQIADLEEKLGNIRSALCDL